MPGIASIITVAVTTAVSTAMKDITNTLSLNMQKINLEHRYKNDRLEQYTRKDNLRIFGIEEEPDEDKDILQAKVIEVAANVGVKLEADDISIAHRLGKVGDRSRPVIVRFCYRKKRNAVVKNKKIYINEDLTPLRSTLMKMVKEQEAVRNVTSRNGKILAWLEDKERPVKITTPDDLFKVESNLRIGSA
ncbi:hypothetical protein E2C01_072478 [Portunus trituberculatus]|uniref:Uncharacterized protein n=1 Tax=Portunus trituberculatus TaxID=210409 RepID=A0A5B7I919_PORTR|nr:hypothetical protein [Portunus trituberculatus]